MFLSGPPWSLVAFKWHWYHTSWHRLSTELVHSSYPNLDIDVIEANHSIVRCLGNLWQVGEYHFVLYWDRKAVWLHKRKCHLESRKKVYLPSSWSWRLYSAGHKFCTFNSLFFGGHFWTHPIFSIGLVDHHEFFRWPTPSRFWVISTSLEACLKNKIALFANPHRKNVIGAFFWEGLIKNLYHELRGGQPLVKTPSMVFL